MTFTDVIIENPGCVCVTPGRWLVCACVAPVEDTKKKKKKKILCASV